MAPIGGVVIEDLGNIGDFIGGIGVVMTLVYLATQVRQNTVALKTAGRQQIVAGMREFNRLRLLPEAEVFDRGARSFSALAEHERRQYAAYLNDLLLFFQGAHALHEAGTLEPEVYDAYLTFVASHLTTPGGVEYWQRVAHVFTPRMVTALDTRVAEGGLLEMIFDESASE